MSNATEIFLVTGTSSGVGAALLEKLLNKGQRVVGLCRRDNKKSHSRYTHIPLDLERPNWSEVASQFQRIERTETLFFIMNAGVNRPDICERKLNIIEFLTILNINVLQQIRLLEHAVQQLNPRKVELILIGSYSTYYGTPANFGYALSKGIFHEMAKKSAVFNVTNFLIKNIVFGGIYTPMYEANEKTPAVSFFGVSGWVKKKIRLTPEQAAEEILELLDSKKNIHFSQPFFAPIFWIIYFLRKLF